METFGVLQIDPANMIAYQDMQFQYAAQGYPAQPYQFSPPASGLISPLSQGETEQQMAYSVGGPNDLMTFNPNHIFQPPVHQNPPQIPNHHERQMAMTNNAPLQAPLAIDDNVNNFLASQQSFAFPSVEVADGQDLNFADLETAAEHYFENSLQNGNGIPASAFAAWEEELQTTTNSWNHPQQFESPVADNQLLLQQSAAPIAPAMKQQHDIPHVPSNAGAFTLPSNEPSVQSSRTASQTETGVMQTQFMGPSPKSSPPFINPAAIPLPQEPFSRRGSDSSELAKDLNTIQLQRVQSQQTSDEEVVFKTPPIPQLSLAARRKRPRPAALGTMGMRSHSCTGPQNLSPVMKTAPLGVSNSVRRIKSTGNNLNVIGGRVQKSVAPPQRSPLSFQTFHEAMTFDELQSGPPTNSSFVQPNSGPTPVTPQSPVSNEHSVAGWTKPLVHSNSNPNILPTQNQQINPFESHAKSSPHTPFTQGAGFMPHYQAQAQYMAPPQSAPAHMVSFPNVSPPFQAMPVTPSGYFPNQPQLPESYFYYPTEPQMPQQQVPPSFDYHPQPGMYNFQHPHIIHDSPPLRGHGHAHFYPNPPPPQKELEVVMTTFPKPEDSHAPPKEPYRPKQFTFQNSGPDDF